MISLRTWKPFSKAAAFGLLLLLGAFRFACGLLAQASDPGGSIPSVRSEWADLQWRFLGQTIQSSFTDQ